MATYGLLNLEEPPLDNPPSYLLQTVVGYNSPDHKTACIEIAQWLEDKLKPTVSVLPEKYLDQPYKYEQPSSSILCFFW